MIYEPKEDSFLLADQVRKYSKNKSVLDLGTGFGIQAREAKKAGAKSIIASDINPESFVQLTNDGITAIQSDLFEKIEGRFDLIIFNAPYLPKDEMEDAESSLITSGGEKGDEIILRFLQKCPEHLNEGGMILLLLSSLTPHNRIKNILKRLKMKYDILSSQKLFFEEIFVWKIQKQ
jgi:release factor glutamine methyltransferase